MRNDGMCRDANHQLRRPVQPSDQHSPIGLLIRRFRVRVPGGPHQIRGRGTGPPCDDASARLWTYADAALDAIGDRTDLLVVGQSFGGFTAQLIYDRTAVDVLVLVAGMIPSPGEAPKIGGRIRDTSRRHASRTKTHRHHLPRRSARADDRGAGEAAGPDRRRTLLRRPQPPEGGREPPLGVIGSAGAH